MSNKLVKSVAILLTALLMLLPAGNAYASSDKIYEILSKVEHKSNIRNPKLLKALGISDSKKTIKIISTRNEVKEEIENKAAKNSNKYILGLDVSKWNGTIDWKAVKKAGIQFVIIRAGYGTGYVDPYFKRNIEAAIENNLLIGVYWFSYSHTFQGAKLEAEKCIKTIKSYKKHITLPVFWDFEYDSVDYAKKNGHYIDKNLASGMADTFCTTINSKGFRAGIYTNIDYSNRYFSKDVLAKYHTWIAQWTSNCTYKEHYIMWQCSDNYYIGNKRYDLNKLYIDKYNYDIQSSKIEYEEMTVSATAYSGDGITSTMIKPKWGVIAVDPRVIPYGSIVYIPYFNKYFVAEDCGGGIKGKKIDIFMDSEAKCRQWGVRKIKIKIVKGGKNYAQ